MLPIFMAATLLMLVCVVLFFLTIGFFGSVLVVMALLFGFAGIHYVIWGWWLSRIVRDEDHDDPDVGYGARKE